jgi:hypothetical protein
MSHQSKPSGKMTLGRSVSGTFMIPKHGGKATSIVKGAGTVFDIAGHSFRRSEILGMSTDLDRLSKDFHAVGDDLRVVLGRGLAGITRR